MKYRPYHSIALVLAVVLNRSSSTRIRISEKTFKRISGRSTLRDALITNVKALLEDYGAMMFRLDRGGFAIVAISAFEGAPSATLRSTFPEWNSTSDQAMAEELGLEDADEYDDE
ncbi:MULTISPECIES: hypothetical protein [unclassified Novosphingobium]|uniref:hypothetical protein n=1 Tax=unclassified Novosphingobium TaxID=2644732 RepID=UPI0025E205F5|nr:MULTISPECIES: hypothetical protein [unclassified Novosphingobium]HQV03842.1 hypothetical protein [Novosphingobium sp.]